ncbi:MAG: glutamate--tRNA ligase [Chloroflexia bacterium]|nr:glutamate--tRNA ligase [Chloroflexia bacterium]
MTTTPRQVRVRFAPSPTGPFHAGGARTVLYNWLFARRHAGTLILRIEDTDRARYSAQAEADLLDSLRWLGITWDEGPEVGGPYAPYVQSQRTELYRHYAQVLLDCGCAYKCFCSAERLAQMRQEQRQRGEGGSYDRHCRRLAAEERAALEKQGRSFVIRLKVPPEGQTVVQDRIRGEITFDNTVLEDAILLKSDGYPTYHLANVVDDHLMEISHVMRGDEWLSSTPLHVIMYEAFGWQPPVFAHLPVILSPTGQGKMSKRKVKGPGGKEYYVLVQEFRQAGYLPEAMVNFLARLGWAYDDRTEVFDLEEMIANFSLDGVSSSPAAFSYDKLLWMNGVYIRSLEVHDLARRCLPFLQQAGLVPDPCPPATWDYILRMMPLLQPRIATLADVVEHSAYFFTSEIVYDDPQLLLPKKGGPAETRAALAQVRQRLAVLESFDEATLETVLREMADTLGWKAGQLFMPIRGAVTGRKVSPGLFETLSVLGQARTLQRLDRALEALQELED